MKDGIRRRTRRQGRNRSGITTRITWTGEEIATSTGTDTVTRAREPDRMKTRVKQSEEIRSDRKIGRHKSR